MDETPVGPGGGWYLSPRKARGAVLCCRAVSLGKFSYPIHGGCSQFQDTPYFSKNDLDSSGPECISDISPKAFHEHSKVAREALLASWRFAH